MKAKALEIRDKGTFVPALAIEMTAENGAQSYLLRRSGYGSDQRLIMLTKMQKGYASYNAYDWNDRTMKTAHLYIEEHWDELEDGSVICVETILGERAVPKVSERFEEIS